MRVDAGAGTLLCPSAQPDMANAQVFGLLAGTPQVPMVAYLRETMDPDDLRPAGVAGGVEVIEFARVAASCETSSCAHFSGNRCSLATRIVEQLPAVVDLLPRCAIRASCRWFAEQGPAACRRCPAIVTRERDTTASAALRTAAMPR